MTVQETPRPVISRVVDVFGEWLRHRRELREMREIDAANFGRIAVELRLSANDLEDLVRQGPHSADELPKMLTALGIDQDTLVRTEPLVLRDMEKVRLAATSASATATSPPAQPPRTTRSIARTRPRSTASGSG
jgi:hypothetical protein